MSAPKIACQLCRGSGRIRSPKTNTVVSCPMCQGSGLVDRTE